MAQQQSPQIRKQTFEATPLQLYNANKDGKLVIRHEDDIIYTSKQLSNFINQFFLMHGVIKPISVNKLSTHSEPIEGELQILAIRKFINNELKLKTEIEDMNNKKFSELTQEDQHYFLNRNIKVHIYKNLTEEQCLGIYQYVKYE